MNSYIGTLNGAVVSRTHTSSPMKVFENSNIVIELDKDLQCLIQHWSGFASTDKFREAIYQTVDLFRKHNLNKILSNTKNFGIVKKEDTDWTNSYSMPLLIESGLQYVAFIIPDNVFPQMSVKNFSKGAVSEVEIQYFKKVEDAKSWMTEIRQKDEGEQK